MEKQFSQKGFALIYLLAGVLILAALGGVYYFTSSTLPHSIPISIPPSAAPFPSITVTGAPSPTTPSKSLLPEITENNEDLTPEKAKQILPIEDVSSWKVYTNSKYGFEFRYPTDFSDSCCNISGPTTGDSERIIVLANESTTMQGTDKPFDGIGIYVVPNSNNLSLNDYLAKEKQQILDTGSKFPITGKEIESDGVRGVLLSGYLFRIEIAYFPLKNHQAFLAISKSEEAKGSFETQFNQILTTLKFND